MGDRAGQLSSCIRYSDTPLAAPEGTRDSFSLHRPNSVSELS